MFRQHLEIINPLEFDFTHNTLVLYHILQIVVLLLIPTSFYIVVLVPFCFLPQPPSCFLKMRELLEQKDL